MYIERQLFAWRGECDCCWTRCFVRGNVVVWPVYIPARSLAVGHIARAFASWPRRAAKIKYEAEQKEMARLQGFIDRFGAQVSKTCRMDTLLCLLIVSILLLSVLGESRGDFGNRFQHRTINMPAEAPQALPSP